VPLPERCTALFRDLLNEIYNGLLEFVVNVAPEGSNSVLVELDLLAAAGAESEIVPASVSDKRTKEVAKSGVRVAVNANGPEFMVQSAGESATGAGSKYVLANAKAGTGARSSAVGTTGNAAAATRYRLDGEDKTISPHVNHQVEITGTVQSNSASATGAAASAGAAAAGPMLKVDSVKMISATCQQP